MSPTNLEKKILAFENAFVLRASRLPFMIFPLALIVLALAYHFLFYHAWSHAYPTWSGISLFQDRYWISMILVLSAALVFWIPQRLYVPFLTLGVLAGWYWSCWKMRGLNEIAHIFPIYILLVLGLFAFFPKRRFLKLTLVVGLFLICISVMGYLAAAQGDYKAFKFFWSLHPEYLLLNFMYWSFGDQSWTAVAPTTILNPLPLPSGSCVATDPTERRNIFLRGFYNLLVGEILLLLVLTLLNHVQGFKNPFAQGLYGYCVFLLMVVAGFNVTNAALRLFLIKAPDATYFVFLARSPLEIWERASVYIYRFVVDIIYFPLYRRVRSLTVSLLACLALIYVDLFFLHEVALRNILHYVVPNLPVSAFDYWGFFLRSIAWIGIWAVLSIVFIKLRRLLYRGKSWQDWGFIIVTHLVCSQIMLAATGVAVFIQRHVR